MEKSKKLQDEESEKVEESEPVSVPPRKKQSKSKKQPKHKQIFIRLRFNFAITFNFIISSESASSAKVKSVAKSRVRRVAVDNIPAPSSAEIVAYDSQDVAALKASRLAKDWKKMKEPLWHLSTEVVDPYQDILMQGPHAPKDVTAHDWFNLMHEKDEKEFDARLKAFKGKRFEGKSRILWIVYGFSHFAVLDISLIRVIMVYDSILKTAKKWVTGRLQRLLRFVAGGEDDFRVEVKRCAEQVNCDD